VRFVVPDALDAERVDRVVSFLAGVPRAEAAAIVDAGGVSIGGRTVLSRSRRVALGEVVEIILPDPPAGLAADPTVAVDVVFADDAVIVVDKPAGLVVHPGAGNRGGTLVNGLLARFGDLAAHPWPDADRPGIVHRLDKGTSGLLMVARTPAALMSLTAQLAAHTVERSYLALVWGAVEAAAGVVDAPIARSPTDPTRMSVRAEGRRAVTGYEVVSRWEHPQPATLLRCRLETGRTHQIRVHLAAIGHPVVGDTRYHERRRTEVIGRGRRGLAMDAGVDPGRPVLHAAVLGFAHPVSGAPLRFESPLPAELRAVLDAFS